VTSTTDGGQAGTFVATRDGDGVRFDVGEAPVDTDEDVAARVAWLSVLAEPHTWTSWGDEGDARLVDEAHRRLAGSPRFARRFGHAPVLGTTGPRIRALLRATSLPARAQVLVVGDLAAVAVALADEADVEHWSDAHTEHDDTTAYVRGAPDALFPPDETPRFDAAVVDLLPGGPGVVTHLSRALARVKDGGTLALVAHPRLRDDVLPGVLRGLPVATRACHVDVVWRVLPGYSLADVPWDVWVVEKTGPLALAAPHAPWGTRTHLDSTDRIVLAEEILGFKEPVEGAHLDLALDRFTAALSLDVRSRESRDDNLRAVRRLALADGAFVDLAIEREHNLVSFALGDWDPLTQLRLGTALLVSLPPRDDLVRFRRAESPPG